MSQTSLKDYPHSYIVIFLLIIVAAFLTWFIPAGHFARALLNGKSYIDASNFIFSKNNPIDFIELPFSIIKAINLSSHIIILVLIVGGAFNVILKTGTFQSFILKLARVLRHKEELIIPVLSIVFALACLGLGVDTFIGFTPACIILARFLGFDALVGVCFVMIGGACGFIGGAFNPATKIAQDLVHITPYSGVIYRLLSTAVFLLLSNLFLINYAKKLRLNPKTSLVYNYAEDEYYPQYKKLLKAQKHHYFTLACVLVFFTIICFGAAFYNWGQDHNAALFLCLGILAGLIARMSPSTIAAEFVKGTQMLVYGALIIGLARSISLVLEEGGVLESIVFYTFKLEAMLPSYLQSIGMFLSQLFISIFIDPSSLQARLSLPSAMNLCLNHQVCVLAFNYAQGIGSFFFPTSSVLMGFLAVANVAYTVWAKFFYKLFLLWVLAGLVLILVATHLNLS